MGLPPRARATTTGLVALALGLAACSPGATSPAVGDSPSGGSRGTSSAAAPPGRAPATTTRTPASAGASPTPARTAVPPYLASARWTTRAGERALVVTPTDSGRAGPDPDALWAELLDLAPAADTPGMRTQLLCHAALAPTKARWNLEPSRPDVGLVATIRARCNPGDAVDPDETGPPR